MKAMMTTLLVALLFGVGLLHGEVGKNRNLLNPNIASKEQLMSRGMPEGTANDVIANRPFLDMLALDAVLENSMSEQWRAEMYLKVFVPLNLNTASNDEITLIPNVGPRMAHEFEEYRPYKAMAQFRREIGKYVDDEEVARLEQYVFSPIDLNTATEEDILSIPGVGQRMLHEFLEYRPYKSIAQFRREIGKYVNDKELARLERYVTLNP